MPKRIFIIDGSSYIFRAFYGIRASLSNSKGLPTNAIYGFARMLLKVIREEKPDHLAMVFDSGKKTTRHEYFPEYKANRSAMPEDLVPQIPYIHRLVESFDIKVVCRDGIEADDIIGTLALEAGRQGFDVTIVSGDKDMMQLVGDGVTMLDTMKDKRIGPDDVEEKMGVPPEKVVEVMGLMGDSSDNIPGVPGVGPKTAVKLINQFGCVEEAINRADEIKKKGVREKVIKFADQARLSKRLVTIVTDLDIGLGLDEFKARDILPDKVKALFKELDFSGLLSEVTAAKALKDRPEKDYHTVVDWKAFDEMLKGMEETGRFAIDLETTSKRPVLARIVGISISFKPHEAWYVPVAHEYLGCPAQLEFGAVLERLKPILEEPEIKKIGQNIKYEKIVLKNAGVDLKGIEFDTMIASYLLDPNKRNHNLNDLALTHLDHRMITYKEVAGTGQKEIGFHEVDICRASEYSCEDADATFLLAQKLGPMLEAEGLDNLYRSMEMPLLEVLAEIEMNGVGIDREFLLEMSRALETRLNDLMKLIHSLAGEEFNINSPKQLSGILFEKLGLPVIKKTKNGFSTGEEVLEKLAARHELPAEMLNYRKLNKLRSTYVSALPAMINPATGRVHTSFNQTVVSTGRLSSTGPNLQNIPIQTEIGREVRKAFIAGEGRLILSADYSQVELRLLAHLSGDEFLIDSFNRGEDIHARTASEVFHILKEMVTPQMRRMAKSVNFGIIYGLSAFGLAKQIGVGMREAKEFIDRYFKLYKKVKEYIDEVVADAKAEGSVYTIMGRRRHIPELSSSNKTMREFGRRMAVNSPIQGSAADLIKMAMINISGKIKEEGLKSKMIIQVHDELIFEVPVPEKEAMKELVRRQMEEVFPLKVPLTVDLGFGGNWDEAH